MKSGHIKRTHAHIAHVMNAVATAWCAVAVLTICVLLLDDDIDAAWN